MSLVLLEYIFRFAVDLFHRTETHALPLFKTKREAHPFPQRLKKNMKIKDQQIHRIIICHCSANIITIGWKLIIKKPKALSKPEQNMENILWKQNCIKYTSINYHNILLVILIFSWQVKNRTSARNVGVASSNWPIWPTICARIRRSRCIHAPTVGRGSTRKAIYRHTSTVIPVILTP